MRCFKNVTIMNQCRIPSYTSQILSVHHTLQSCVAYLLFITFMLTIFFSVFILDTLKKGVDAPLGAIDKPMV